jgi:ABC-type transporter MlaC component
MLFKILYTAFMTKIAFVTNAPPFSGMGKPAREVFSRLRENNIDSDFFI